MFGIGRDDKVRDPVCGMNVDKNKTQFSYEEKGEKVYFCSQNCKDIFVKDINKSVKTGSKSCC
jgi:YHS domain-containing protein